NGPCCGKECPRSATVIQSGDSRIWPAKCFNCAAFGPNMKKNLLAVGSALLWLLLPCATFAQPLYQNLGVNFSVTGWTNNQAQLLLSCESGVNYVIESSTDLQNWTRVLANSDSSILRSFIIDATNDASFYRVGRGILPVFQAALAASG